VIEVQVEARQKVRPFTYVAAAFTVVVTAVWWFYLTGQNTNFYPAFFEYYYPMAFGLLALAALVGIFLNIVAGWYGGIDRRIGVISNVILLSPGAYFVLANIIGIILLGIG
jgi:uncharacterized protein involved in response to NO